MKNNIDVVLLFNFKNRSSSRIFKYFEQVEDLRLNQPIFY